MYKFNKIGQFANTVKEVQHASMFVGMDESGKPMYDHSKPYPILKFTGTVKLHGTNAAIVKENGEIYLQSRNNVITDGHYGFVSWFNALPEIVKCNIPDNTVTYGEWCGSGVQRGVGIAELQKMFVVFSVLDLTTGNKTLPSTVSKNGFGIYSITDFPTYSIEINFNKPHEAQTQLQEITEMVENECPVAKQLGVSGIGEGVVWSSEDFKYMFKVKGKKHSVTKVKVLAAVDVKKLNSVSEFCDKTVTDNRLNQGLDFMKEQGKEINNEIFRDYIKWVLNDIREEEVLLMEASGLTMKDIGKTISSRAAKFLKNKLNEV